MMLGMCSSCRNTADLHRGPDGRGYCEDCLKKLSSPVISEPSVEGGRFSEPEKKTRRDEYLEFIITHVTDFWIEKFLNEWKNEMKRSYGWVAELRKIDDDYKLLRLAAELGYGKKEKYMEPKLKEAIYVESKDGEDIGHIEPTSDVREVSNRVKKKKKG